MLEEYLGLFGLLGIGIGAAFCLYALASILRRRFPQPSNSRDSSLEPQAEQRISAKDPSTSRYFSIAVVGLMLHAGSFYFYLWGASLRKTGLMGLMVMLGFGLCLMMGVFYSWARGAVASATEDETQAKTMAPNA